MVNHPPSQFNSLSAIPIPSCVFVCSPIYSLGPPWPSLDHPMECDDEETFDNLARFLEKRIATRNTLTDDHKEQRESLMQIWPLFDYSGDSITGHAQVLNGQK